MTRHQPLACLTLAATILIAFNVMALEKRSAALPADERLPAQVYAPLDEPLAHGRVVAVDRAAGRITLDYRPIPELFLVEGGKRIFRVQDPTALKGLGPGDKVRFEVERNGRAYTITRIENSN